MNHADFVTLYEYNSWANRKMLDSLSSVSSEEFTMEMTGSFGSLRDTLAHILGAESVWLSRWKLEPSLTFLRPKDVPTIASLRDQWQIVESGIKEFIHNFREEDLARTFSYKNIKGEPYDVQYGHAFQHVANHSTYHRGQVSTLLRQLGHMPIPTDMLYFHMERNAQAAAQ